MTLVFFLCLILQYWGSVWSVWMFIIQLCSFTLCCVICVFLCVFQPQSVTISVSICISSLGMPECVCVGVCVSLDKSQVRGSLTDHIRQPACRRADWNQNPPQESNNSQSTWGETASIITTVNSSRTCKHDVILTARSHRDHWWYGYTSILNSRLPQTFVFKKKKIWISSSRFYTQTWSCITQNTPQRPLEYSCWNTDCHRGEEKPFVRFLVLLLGHQILILWVGRVRVISACSYHTTWTVTVL